MMSVIIHSKKISPDVSTIKDSSLVLDMEMVAMTYIQ